MYFIRYKALNGESDAKLRVNNIGYYIKSKYHLHRSLSGVRTVKCRATIGWTCSSGVNIM